MHMTPDLEFADTPTSRCEFYRRICDLPAVIDRGYTHQIVIPATRVWAVVTPTHMGIRVKNMLQQHNFRTGPIMNHPRSGRWSFLVAPGYVSDDTDLPMTLYRVGAAIVRDGSAIALPGPGVSEEFRTWIDPPVNGFRPPAYQVVQAVRICLTPQPGAALPKVHS